MSDNKHPLFDQLIEAAYDRFKASVGWSKPEFHEQLNAQELVAVHCGNLNYQVENGGFCQWGPQGNDYGTPKVNKYLIELMDRINSKVGSQSCIQVKKILLAFKASKSEAVEDILNTFFYEINNQFLDDVEKYLQEGGE